MPEGNVSILLVAEDPQTLRYWRAVLGGAGGRILEARTTGDGENLAESHSPGVVLLDLILADPDGLDFMQRMRRRRGIPVITIGLQSRVPEAIQALDAGADDCLMAPVGRAALWAAIRSALRRGNQDHEPVSPPLFTLGRWSVDQLLREVRVEGQRISLKPDEYQLLITLVRHAGQVLTHGRLIREIWADDPRAQPEHVSLCMSRLRQQLELDPLRPRHLVSELGIGYRLRVP